MKEVSNMRSDEDMKIEIECLRDLLKATQEKLAETEVLLVRYKIAAEKLYSKVKDLKHEIN